MSRSARWVASFEAAAGTQAGALVKLTANGQVGPCSADGDIPAGVVTSLGEGLAAVQMAGYVEVPCDTALTVGWQAVASSADGELEKATAAGRDALVVWVDAGCRALRCVPVRKKGGKAHGLFWRISRWKRGCTASPARALPRCWRGLDSSEQYRGTPLEGLDAYQRQLKRFGIRVSGPGSDPVEKFFQSSSSAALFPEYVARAVGQGMEAADQLKDMVATVTKIDGLDYRTITVEGEETRSPEGGGPGGPAARHPPSGSTTAW